MKVISGILKGRNIKGYNIDGTRPTMDRVKESLFASINSYKCHHVDIINEFRNKFIKTKGRD